jgi:hypothetical protein
VLSLRIKDTNTITRFEESLNDGNDDVAIVVSVIMLTLVKVAKE